VPNWCQKIGAKSEYRGEADVAALRAATGKAAEALALPGAEGEAPQSGAAAHRLRRFTAGRSV
jgi:hypothetical protein